MNDLDLSQIDQNSLQHLSDDALLDVLRGALATLSERQDLTRESMCAVMHIIMAGRCPEPMMAAIITALRLKGESDTEISSAAAVMRDICVPVPVTGGSVDIVGTGGDGANLFNISTASAFVMAAAGAKVAKHGSTGVSTTSGASDLLQQAGLDLSLPPDGIATAIDELGVAFMFAPNHHPAMRHAKSVRALLKIRTLFNVVGPLTNPARPSHALMGAYSQAVAKQTCQAMQHLGARHVLAVHSEDGLDEISLAAPTFIAELKDGVIRHYTITPEALGVPRQCLDGLVIRDIKDSLDIITKALSGASHDPVIQKAQAIIALNAGAGLYAADKVGSIADGVALAQSLLATDAAYKKLQALAQFSQHYPKSTNSQPT